MNILSFLTKLFEAGIHIELVNDQLKIHAPGNKLTPVLIEELKQNKQEIIDFFKKNIQKQVRFTAVMPAEKKEYYPLSAMQKSLYFLQQMDPRTTVYNMPIVIEINEHPDINKLTGTFKKLIDRHEALRTSFENIEEEPLQRIHPEVAFKIEADDTYDTDGAEDIKPFVRPFNLAEAPLFRVKIQKNGEKYFLLVDIHHVISDGISQEILKNDFVTLYNGQTPEFLKLQYKDFSEWQNNKHQDSALRDQEVYWLKELAGELPLLDLPIDYARPPVQSFDGHGVTFEIPTKESNALVQLAVDTGYTLYTVLFAVFNILLCKLSGQEDIIVGIPTSGRRHVDLEFIIGMFVNTLALRNYPGGEKTAWEFLKEVGERTIQAFDNQDYPFYDLVNKIMVNRDPARNPLFDVMLDLQDMGGKSEAKTTGLANTDIDAPSDGYSLENNVSRFDMTWNGIKRNDRLFFGIEYCTRLFKKETILKFIHYFQQIISTISLSPGQKIKEIEIISAQEKAQILHDFNNTAIDVPPEAKAIQIFNEIVEKNPGKIAALFKQNQLTYRELEQRAKRLAILLRKKGVQTESIVPILVERSLEMIIGVTAVLKAGGAYLPLDPDYPPGRLDYMLENSGAQLILTKSHLKYPGQFQGEREQIVMDMAWSPDEECEDTGIITEPDSLLYVIYTSGSTGKPKGVMVQNNHYVNATFAWRNAYHLSSIPVNVLQTASFSFDVFAGDFSRALLNAGTLVICSEQDRLYPPALHRLLQNHRISLFEATPSLIIPLMDYIYENNLKIDTLKLLILGSESCPVEEFKQLLLRFGEKMRVINSYGVTEATIDSMFYEEKDINRLPSSGSVPIGKPLPNMSAFIMNAYKKLQPAGIPGELYIGGRSVARGYLKNPKLTAERFFDNPFILGERLYKTGDLVKWLPDGNVEFLGRVDNQLKIRGFRIELGEIETQLLGFEGIKEAFVTAVQGLDQNLKICAYFIPDKTIAVPALKEYLSAHLPAYMIPSHFVQIQKFPLTPNGKIDRKALPVPELNLTGDFVSPQGNVEEKLVAIWSALLGLKEEAISCGHNFFELGGTSVKLLMLISKIYKTFNTQVPLMQIYNNPTIKGIALCINAGNLTEESVVLLNRESEKKIFCFPPQIGYGFCYTALASKIKDYSFYAFNFIEEEDRLEKYIEQIKKRQPMGPYVLLGYSSAGELTFEVAKSLENQGSPVSDIIFFDSFFLGDKKIGRQKEYLDESYMHTVYDNISKNVEQLGISFLKDKVKEKTLNYMKYYENVIYLETIQSNVHLILSEGITERETVDIECWNKLTAKTVFYYHALGSHLEIFDPGPLENNVKIITDILGAIQWHGKRD